MNKVRKAGFTVCLFLFITVHSFSQQWTFSREGLQLYEQVLDLKFNPNESFSQETSAEQLYAASLAEALELLITEDKQNFNRYEERFEKRLELKADSRSEVLQFLRAELHLQWAFVYLKFGQEFDAASHLHEAYKIAHKCKRKYPKFQPIRKTTGLLEIMIGSVPEKYSWLLSVLGMKGSIARGVEDLQMVMTSESPFVFEAKLLHAIVTGFVFQQPDKALKGINELMLTRPDSRAAIMLGAVMAMKNSSSEEALVLLRQLDKTTGLGLAFTDYLNGEVLLHKGDYTNAIAQYQKFLQNWKGDNYIKDSYFKVGLCYHLQNQPLLVSKYFLLAKENGIRVTEADKSAARSVEDDELPNVILSKARYAMDGGYYQNAADVFSLIKDKDIPTKRDQVEYYYRKARLEHKTNHLSPAKLFYKQTIDMAGNEPWYFAPNASLQLGYIYLQEHNNSEAQSYFKKALTYKHHEYKNSIDTKARSALNEMGRAED